MADLDVDVIERAERNKVRVCRACGGNGWTWETPRMPVVGHGEEYRENCGHCGATGVMPVPADETVIALVEEVRRLDRLVAAQTMLVTQHHGVRDRLRDEVIKAEAEVERLRAGMVAIIAAPGSAVQIAQNALRPEGEHG